MERIEKYFYRNFKKNAACRINFTLSCKLPHSYINKWVFLTSAQEKILYQTAVELKKNTTTKFYITKIISMKIRILCFLLIVFCTKIFASERELPIGRLHGIGFSLEKNGVSILSHKNFYYHDSNLKIEKISSDIYELTVSVYLQKTQGSKALSDNRVDRYKVIWNTDFMGALINEKNEYKRDQSEFLLSNDTLIIKSQIADSGVIETQSYTIAK